MGTSNHVWSREHASTLSINSQERHSDLDFYWLNMLRAPPPHHPTRARH